MVEAYQASGLSAPRFAALHGVNYQTLVSWIKKGKMAVSGRPRRIAVSRVPVTGSGGTRSRRRGPRHGSVAAGWRETRHHRARPGPTCRRLDPRTRKPTAMLSFSGSSESVRGGGTLRHAPQLQRPARRGEHPAHGGSQERLHLSPSPTSAAPCSRFSTGMEAGCGFWQNDLNAARSPGPRPPMSGTANCASTPPRSPSCSTASTCATAASGRGMKSGRKYIHLSVR